MHKQLKLSLFLLFVLILSSCTQTNQPNNQTAPVTLGLYAEYFSEPDFTGVRRAQIDSELNFNWGTSSPTLNLPKGMFSARWTGYLHVQQAENYQFDILTNSNASLRINENPIKPQESIYLTKGKHPIKLEFVKTSNATFLELLWSKDTEVLESIASIVFSYEKSIITQSLLPPPSSNLILNGGFEDEISNWNLIEGRATIRPRKPDPSDESLILSISVNRPDDPTIALLEQNIPISSLLAGETYLISASGYVASTPSCTVGLKGGKDTPNGKELLFDKQLELTKTDWQYKAASITIPEETSWAKVYVLTPPGVCLADDISFSRKAPLPSSNNLILNSDFSQSNYAWATLSGESKLVSGVEGEALGLGSSSWVQQDLDSRRFEAGQNYKLSADIIAGQGCNIGIWGGSPNALIFNKLLVEENNSNEWQNYELLFNLPKDTQWATLYASSYFLSNFHDCVIDNIIFELTDQEPPVFDDTCSDDKFDPALLRFIKSKLGLTTNQRISDCNDLLSLTSIENLFQLESLRGIELLKNLTTLSIQNTNITDLTPLNNLTNLKRLSIIISNITDLTPLAQLTQLEEITLADAKISNISPLASVTQLQSLRINRNLISNLSPLNSLPNLKSLIINRNCLVFNEEATQSSLLNLIDQGVKFDRFRPSTQKGGPFVNCNYPPPPPPPIDPCQDLTRYNFEILRELRLKLKTPKGQALANCNDLANITELTLDDPFTLDGIELLTNLESLVINYAANIGSNEWARLTELKNLQTLNVSSIFSRDRDYTFFSSMSSLRFLSIKNTDLDSLKFLPGLDNLKTLKISSSIRNITDLTPLRSLPNLEELLLNNNFISRIDVFSSGFKKLRKLELKSNQIPKTQAFVDGLPALETLDISSNCINFEREPNKTNLGLLKTRLDSAFVFEAQFTDNNDCSASSAP